MESPVTCQNCGGVNPADAQFCIECGQSLSLVTGPTTRLPSAVCRSCGAENPAVGQFCSMCGQPLGAEPAAQPWPAVQTPRHARAHRPQAPRPPRAQPRPVQSYPRIHTGPAPIAPAAAGKRHGSGGISLAGAVLLVGVVALMLFKALTFPLLLALLAIAFFIQQAERGRAEQALRTLLIVGALVVVLMNPKFWPALLLVFIGAKMIGR